jgi:hypothetical protein
MNENILIKQENLPKTFYTNNILQNNSPKNSQKYTLLKEEFKFYYFGKNIDLKNLLFLFLWFSLFFFNFLFIKSFLVDQIALLNFFRGLVNILIASSCIYYKQLDLEQETIFNKSNLRSMVFLAGMENFFMITLLISLKFVDYFTFNIYIVTFIYTKIIFLKKKYEMEITRKDLLISLLCLLPILINLIIGGKETFKSLLMFSVSSILFFLISNYKSYKLPDYTEELRFLTHGICAVIFSPILLSIEGSPRLNLSNLLICLMCSFCFPSLYYLKISTEKNCKTFESLKFFYTCSVLIIILSFLFTSITIVNILLGCVYFMAFYLGLKFY